VAERDSQAASDAIDIRASAFSEEQRHISGNR